MTRGWVTKWVSPNCPSKTRFTKLDPNHPKSILTNDNYVGHHCSQAPNAVTLPRHRRHWNQLRPWGVQLKSCAWEWGDGWWWMVMVIDGKGPHLKLTTLTWSHVENNLQFWWCVELFSRIVGCLFIPNGELLLPNKQNSMLDMPLPQSTLLNISL